jgi:hypothetical protein
MTTTSRTPNAARPASGRQNATRLPPDWRAPIAWGTAGLLSVGAAGARFVTNSPDALFILGISSALCAVIAGIVAIVTVIAGRSPEIRRMSALQHLARKARSPAERLSAMAMLSVATSSMTGIEKENMAEFLRMILQTPRVEAAISDRHQALETPMTADGRAEQPAVPTPHPRPPATESWQ